MSRFPILTLAALLVLPLPLAAEEGREAGGYGVRFGPDGSLSVRGEQGEAVDISLDAGGLRVRSQGAEGGADVRVTRDGVQVRSAGGGETANVRVDGQGVDVRADAGGDTSRVRVDADGGVSVDGAARGSSATPASEGADSAAAPGFVPRILGGVFRLLRGLFGGGD